MIESVQKMMFSKDKLYQSIVKQKKSDDRDDDDFGNTGSP